MRMGYSLVQVQLRGARWASRYRVRCASAGGAQLAVQHRALHQLRLAGAGVIAHCSLACFPRTHINSTTR